MTREIPLSRGMVALVDDEDYDRVAGKAWVVTPKLPGRSDTTYYAQHSAYVAGGGKRKLLKMHRVILDAPPHLFVDHINGNGLDNRRANIRLATPQQNTVNRSYVPGRSGYRGVLLREGSRRSIAYVSIGRKKVCVGNFASSEEAARAFDAATFALHGEFAVLNFPDDKPSAPPARLVAAFPDLFPSSVTQRT